MATLTRQLMVKVIQDSPGGVSQWERHPSRSIHTSMVRYPRAVAITHTHTTRKWRHACCHLLKTRLHIEADEWKGDIHTGTTRAENETRYLHSSHYICQIEFMNHRFTQLLSLSLYWDESYVSAGWTPLGNTPDSYFVDIFSTGNILLTLINAINSFLVLKLRNSDDESRTNLSWLVMGKSLLGCNCHCPLDKQRKWPQPSIMSFLLYFRFCRTFVFAVVLCTF